MSKFSIHNKVIFLTGSTGHIVGEFVNEFIKEGAICISTDSREEKLHEQIKSIESEKLHTYKLDVTNPDEWNMAVADVMKKFGRIDGLVNGAGMNNPSKFFDIDPENFKKIFDVNLFGMLHGCQKIGKIMVNQKQGSIINISSTAAEPPLSNAFAYSASKAGVTNLTKNLAREFGKTGVRVNSLRPGFFPTEWNKKNFLTQDRIDSILNHTPMGRFGSPDELTSAVQWLLSESSSFVTGSEIIVDGGFSCQTI